MVAARWNYPALLRQALDRGVDPNGQDFTHGNTALMFAMIAPSPEPARILLKQGADTTYQTILVDGESALMMAVRNGQDQLGGAAARLRASVELANRAGEIQPSRSAGSPARLAVAGLVRQSQRGGLRPAAEEPEQARGNPLASAPTRLPEPDRSSRQSARCRPGRGSPHRGFREAAQAEVVERNFAEIHPPRAEYRAHDRDADRDHG